MVARPVRRDGLALALADRGGPGRPLVLQHGLCGGAGQVADLLAGAPDLRPITLDCRGHGGSEAGDPAAFAIATFADDVAAAVDDLAARPAADGGVAGPVVLGGISMGAAIATRLAVRRPDLVGALVLIRPAWVADAAPATMAPNLEVGRLLAACATEADVAAARARFEASPTAARLAAEAPDNLASLSGFFDRAPRAVTAELLTRISLDGPGVTRAELAAVTVPTLVIGSAEDHVHPLAAAEALAALLPAARLVVVHPKGRDRARHGAEVVAALRAFLAAHPERSP